MMYRKAFIALSVLMFLFVGLAYAEECPMFCIDEPGGVNDVLKSGMVSMITLTFGSGIPSNLMPDKEELSYMCQDDTEWTSIVIRNCGIRGCPPIYPWEVNWVSEEKNGCMVRAIIRDVYGVKLLSAKSNTFKIVPYSSPPSDPVKVIQPDGGEQLIPGVIYDILWENNTEFTVAKTVLSYSTDGGTTWKRIAAVTGSPGVYTWNVPQESSVTCRVKVVLKDAAGATLAKDKSDSKFTIQ